MWLFTLLRTLHNQPKDKPVYSHPPPPLRILGDRADVHRVPKDYSMRASGAFLLFFHACQKTECSCRLPLKKRSGIALLCMQPTSILNI